MRRRAKNFPEVVWWQALLADGVASSQKIILPPRHREMITPRFLLQRYLKYIRRITLGLVQPRLSMDGLGFYLAMVGAPLITFSRACGTETVLSLPITGGLLVRRRSGGEITFAAEPVVQGIAVTLFLRRFRPMLLGGEHPSAMRKLLYRYTQAIIHRLVTVRFLVNLYRELEGVKPAVRKERIKEGEDI